jgi:hypothetical protein
VIETAVFIPRASQKLYQWSIHEAYGQNLNWYSSTKLLEPILSQNASQVVNCCSVRKMAARGAKCHQPRRLRQQGCRSPSQPKQSLHFWIFPAEISFFNLGKV